MSGVRIASMADAQEAARRIVAGGAKAVIITGGHANTSSESVVDLLLEADTFHELSTERIASTNTHGTGCTYSAAVAAYLARGCTLAEAAGRAQQYVAGAIAHAPQIGRGRGPLNHFWQFPLA